MFKKKREKKNVLARALFRKEDFLLEKLAKEWDEIERGAKREVLVRRAKEVGWVTAKTILALAAVAGVLTVAVVAPNVCAAFGRTRGRRGFYNQAGFRRSATYLRDKKLVIMKSTPQGYQIELTGKGREKALLVSYKDLKIEPQKKWDGIWRIVAFDIPNRHKWGRECFRNKLKEIGFYPMQESVFVYPYPCWGEVRSLASLFFLEGYIRLIETKNLYDDSDLKESFDLA